LANDVDEARVFLSVITLAEIRYGVSRMAIGRRRRQLDRWLREDLPRRFDGRIVLIDSEIAFIWGEIVAEQQAIGRPIEPMDAFIAATARVHGLALVTRNVADFTDAVAEIINPWTG
jgi:predicted nucleic acid-binding protein